MLAADALLLPQAILCGCLAVCQICSVNWQDSSEMFCALNGPEKRGVAQVICPRDVEVESGADEAHSVGRWWCRGVSLISL